jgi:hypothetical protein
MFMWLDITKYIIVNLLLFSSWYLFLFSKRASLSFVDRLIGTSVLGLAQIILTEMVLGLIFRKLYADPLFWMNICISSALLSLTLSKNYGGLSSLGKMLRELNEKMSGFYRIIRSDIILLILLSLLMIKIGWLIFIGYLFPSYTWDSLMYHLPIVGNIMQSGAIMENPANFEIDTFINIFPKNMELFFLWNIIFLKNSSITDLSQLLFAIVGILTTYSIALKLDIREKSALYSSFLFFFTPIVILQINTNYIDIAVSVLLLITINYLLYESLSVSNGPSPIVKKDDRKFPLFLAGITAGILLGSKGSGPLFAIIISTAIIIQEFLKHQRQISFTNSAESFETVKGSVPFYITCFFFPLILLGSYWYIKNWVLYGNPVYPMEIAFFNVTLFKGLYKKMLDPLPPLIENSTYFTRLFNVWMERVEFYLYDSRLSGFGPLWVILLLPSLVFASISSAIRKRYNWLFISAVLIIIFAVHPRNWTTRYTIFMVALGAVSYGFVIDFFSRKDRVLGIIALALATYTFLTVNSPCVMPAKIREFMNLPARERTLARHKPFNIDIHVRQEYSYWTWINEHVKAGETLAYTFEPLFLTPLWNNGFSNKTKYVRSDNYDDWLQKLKDGNVTYVLLRKHTVEGGWLEANKKDMSVTVKQSGSLAEEFKIVYSDKYYKIVKLTKTQD